MRNRSSVTIVTNVVFLPNADAPPFPRSRKTGPKPKGVTYLANYRRKLRWQARQLERGLSPTMERWFAQMRAQDVPNTHECIRNLVRAAHSILLDAEKLAQTLPQSEPTP